MNYGSLLFEPAVYYMWGQFIEILKSHNMFTINHISQTNLSYRTSAPSKQPALEFAPILELVPLRNSVPLIKCPLQFDFSIVLFNQFDSIEYRVILNTLTYDSKSIYFSLQLHYFKSLEQKCPRLSPKSILSCQLREPLCNGILQFLFNWETQGSFRILS